jgi:long-subunit acyl-CoA synthetase (AMP-forming)
LRETDILVLSVQFILGDYQFTTYRQACARIDAIGRGLLALGVKQDDRILIYSETRPEWLLTAFAAFRHGFTLVTLYSTLGDEAVKHGINESQVKVIITSQELTSKLDVTYHSLVIEIANEIFLFLNDRKHWTKWNELVMLFTFLLLRNQLQ